MKKTVLISAMALSLYTQAQIGKGRMMLGGSFNYNQNKNTQNDSLGSLAQQTKHSTFTGSLRYGYFVSDHIMVGVIGTYSNYKDQTQHVYLPVFQVTDKSISNNFSGGLFGRYYKMIGKSKFAVYGELSAVYGGGTGSQKSTSVINTVTTETTHNKTTQSFFGVNVNPGIVYFLTGHIAVESSFGRVGYNMQHNEVFNNASKKISETDVSGFTSGINFSLASVFLGVNFYFGGNKTAAVKSLE
jgi:hypothetical protein